MSRRAYNSESRKAKAEETKTRILESAKKLFREGFEHVTIERLAKAADVSAPTIYALFQSKRGVLLALMDEALPTERFKSLVEMAMREKSVEKRLRIAAKISREMYDAERAQMEIFQGASILSPEFKEVEKEREARRYKRLEKSIKIMAQENSLKKELSSSKARDILWAFTGRDMYRLFVIEQKWTPDEYEKWLGPLLIQTLIEK